MPLTRLTPLEGETILPLADAKQHLRVLHDDVAEDALIRSLRDAAIAHVERVSGVILAEAEFIWTAPRFPACIDLPVRPVNELDGVTYYDSDGEPAEYDGARLLAGKVVPAVGGSWPSANGYAAVTFTAGLSAPEPDLLAAVKLMLGHLWSNREAVSEKAANEMPLGVQALIDTHRQVMV